MIGPLRSQSSELACGPWRPPATQSQEWSGMRIQIQILAMPQSRIVPTAGAARSAPLETSISSGTCHCRRSDSAGAADWVLNLN